MNLARLAGPFREFGAGGGLAYLLDRLLQRLSADCRLVLYELVEQPIGERALLGPAHVAQIRTVVVQPGAPELAQMPRPAEVLEDRFRQGAICLAVYLKERFVGYAWFVAGRYEEDEVRCSYVLKRAHTVFDFDVFVFPAYRLGRAFAAVWHAANAHLRSQGVTHTLSRIAVANAASRRAHAQLGARVIGHALFLRLWRFEWAVSPALGFPWMRAGLRARPELRL